MSVSEEQNRSSAVPGFSPPSNLFALVIGIDNYPHMNQLHGALADANNVLHFLEPHVSSNRIWSLKDSDATRENILRRLDLLSTTDFITKGDPILIFFAGHGARANPPPEWSAGGGKDSKIHLLCPYGFLPTANECESQQGIANIDLANRVNTISHTKGNNITVILDCCYAGGGIRGGDEDSHLTARCVDLDENYIILPSILPDSPAPSILIPQETLAGQSTQADTTADMLNAREGTYMARSHDREYDPNDSGFWSCVVLAACKRTERSLEENGQGRFTKALLKVLRDIRPHGEDELTYEDLMERIPPMINQNPQCIGGGIARRLFQMHDRRRNFLKATKVQGSLLWHVNAGRASGLSIGTCFNAYQNNSRNPPHLGVLRITTISFFGATLGVQTEHSSSIPLHNLDIVYVFQIYEQGPFEDLRLSIADDQPLLAGVRALVGEAHSRGELRVLPDVTLIVDNDETVAFKVDDTAWSSQKLIFLPYQIRRQAQHHRVHCKNRTNSTPEDTFDEQFDDEASAEEFFAEKVLAVITSAASFHFYLHLTCDPSQHQQLSTNVRVECFELDGTSENFKRYVREKEPKNNLIVEGVLDISVAEEKVFGFKIVNDTDVPLYAALFYFDLSDLSIVSYYEPNTAQGQNVDHSIPANGNLTIGYGGGAGRPRRYCLREGQVFDVGVLKLFYSTKWVNYSKIKQTSPFLTGSRVGDELDEEELSVPVWDTVSVHIIQK